MKDEGGRRGEKREMPDKKVGVIGDSVLRIGERYGNQFFGTDCE